MTEQEIIEALKNNMAKFIFMLGELQEKAKEIGKEHFLFLHDEGRWNGVGTDGGFMCCEIYQLDAAYQPEPEILEYEIVPLTLISRWMGLYFEIRGFTTPYLNAPAVIPKEGYRFWRYKYADGVLSIKPVRRNKRQNQFPVAVLFRKAVVE